MTANRLRWAKTAGIIGVWLVLLATVATNVQARGIHIPPFATHHPAIHVWPTHIGHANVGHRPATVTPLHLPSHRNPQRHRAPLRVTVHHVH